MAIVLVIVIVVVIYMLVIKGGSGNKKRSLESDVLDSFQVGARSVAQIAGRHRPLSLTVPIGGGTANPPPAKRYVLWNGLGDDGDN